MLGVTETPLQNTAIVKKGSRERAPSRRSHSGGDKQHLQLSGLHMTEDVFTRAGVEASTDLPAALLLTAVTFRLQQRQTLPSPVALTIIPSTMPKPHQNSVGRRVSAATRDLRGGRLRSPPDGSRQPTSFGGKERETRLLMNHVSQLLSAETYVCVCPCPHAAMSGCVLGHLEKYVCVCIRVCLTLR